MDTIAQVWQELDPFTRGLLRVLYYGVLIVGGISLFIAGPLAWIAAAPFALGAVLVLRVARAALRVTAGDRRLPGPRPRA